MAWEKTYICIDLKTFYASVECAERGRDPLTTNLVVADPDRGPSTICLAISPAMKKLGVRNRCRVFDIPPGIDYIMAKPQMQRYMEVSARIYGIYLEYVSAQDVHVYSIDECFIDATPYLVRYNMTARGFARELMRAVEARTHILATAGIGTNLFLAKVALDILAKKSPDGIAMLDEEAFKRQIWCHRPITDIWGIGPGIAERLAKYHVHDLQGVAAMDEEVLFRELGVNAEYLIDHAHGREPCTIEQIHAYRPAATSINNGQVLPRDYSAAEARTVLREMVDASALDLVSRHCVCDHVSLAIGYGRGTAPNDNLPVRRVDPRRHSAQDDTVFLDEGPAGRTDVFVGEHGKRVARRAGGYASRQRKLGECTNSFRRLMGYFDCLFDEIVDTTRAIKRINIGLGGLMPEEFASYDLFTDMQKEEEELSLQRTVVEVKDRFGKNAILKGTSYMRGATARERNQQIGGHCA